MSDSSIPVPSAPVPVAPAAPASPASPVTFSADQFSQLMAAMKPQGSAVIAEVKTINADVLNEMEQLIAKAKGAPSAVKGGAKKIIADVKAGWPVLMSFVMSAAALAWHAVKLIP